jgi:hypothetical protein
VLLSRKKENEDRRGGDIFELFSSELKNAAQGNIGHFNQDVPN